MTTQYISYNETGYFSKIINDYVQQEPTLRSLYNHYPTIENFKKQLQEKKQTYSDNNRGVLLEVIKKQYKQISTSKATQKNILALEDTNTFTVTTGHQLNLFTGPLYFLYKIIATINLTVQLKEEYPDYHFVPVYWMATEDHDFDEINFFHFNGKKFQWQGPSSATGAVGLFSTEGLDKVFEELKKEFGIGKNAEYLKQLFTQTYLKNKSLAEATHFLVNELFGKQGLVILDASDSRLKSIFIPYIKEELFKQTAYNKVITTIKEIQGKTSNYKIQVTPREINLFYMYEGVRNRIIKKGDLYSVLETDIIWTKASLEKHVEQYPERFSPNVILRTLYQEVILPNLCYIGGGGEIAYWLELKAFFEATAITFPVLLVRNSLLVINDKQSRKLKKLSIDIKTLFLDNNSLINKKVREISNINIDLSSQMNHLNVQFAELYELAKLTDKSFFGAVKAQEQKQLKGLQNLESRLLKAQKKKLHDQVVRITTIKNELFPNNKLQERFDNFSNLYEQFGERFIPNIIEAIDPIKQAFVIVTVSSN